MTSQDLVPEDMDSDFFNESNNNQNYNNFDDAEENNENPTSSDDLVAALMKQYGSNGNFNDEEADQNNSLFDVNHKFDLKNADDIPLPILINNNNNNSQKFSQNSTISSSSSSSGSSTNHQNNNDDNLGTKKFLHLELGVLIHQIHNCRKEIRDDGNKLMQLREQNLKNFTAACLLLSSLSNEKI